MASYDELSGGAAATVADVSRQLAQISKSLASFSEVSKVHRNANTLADAVVVQECPSGLIGCNAAELFEKTGGELNCPPIEMAPDPLIVDHKGRVCYAPDDMREQFRGKNLNLTDLMEKYALKLVKMLESGQNLATAIEVARKGPAGNPIVMNAYANSPRLRIALATLLHNGVVADVTDAEMSELAVVMSKFTDKLAPDTGVEMINLIVNDFNGRQGSGRTPAAAQRSIGMLDTNRGDAVARGIGVHQALTNLFVWAILALKHDQSAAYRTAKLLNCLGYVFTPFKESRPSGSTTQGVDDDILVMAANAVMFLPKTFRDALVADTPTGGAFTAKNAIGTLYRFVVFSVVMSIGEILAPNRVPEGYCRAIEGLKLAFTEMRNKRSEVQEYAQRKYNGDLGLLVPTASEDAVYLEAKKAADRMYVARVVEFTKVCCSRAGIKFESPLTANSVMAPADDKNYFEAGLQAAFDHLSSIRNIGALTRAPGAALPNANAPANASIRDRAVITFIQTLGSNIRLIRDLFFDATNGIGAYGHFIAEANRYSRQSTDLINVPEDPSISAQQLLSVKPGQQGALSSILAQDTYILTTQNTAIPNVCQVSYQGKPFFLHNKFRSPFGNSPSAAQQASFDAFITVVKTAFENGDGDALVRSLNNGVNADNLRYLVHRECKPLQNPKDAYTRLRKVLSQATAVDQLFAQRTGGAPQSFYEGEGLPAEARDAYVRLLIALQGIGDPEQVATIILASSTSARPFVDLVAFTRRAGLPSGPAKVSTGMRLGGGEDGAVETFEGGEGEHLFEDTTFEGGDDFENAADFLLNGGAVPAHQMPKHLHRYLSAQAGVSSQSKKEADLKKKLKDLGYEITTVFTGKKCPTYARDSNNSFGLPGHKEWVATHSAWPKCMELMGVQFVSEEGYCYPYGMSCYAEDDVTTHTKKTVAKAENWMEMARIYNSVQQKRYEDWLENEKARIRLEPINANLSEADVLELAKSHMPVEFKGVPERAAVSTLSVVASELAASVNEFTTSNESAVKAKIREVLRSGFKRGEWESDDKFAEAQAMDTVATRLYDDTKACTDAAIAESKLQPSDRTKFVPAGKSWAAKCDVEKFPDANSPTGEQEVLVPKEIHSEMDFAALEKGEPPERIVEWWQEYYGKRILEKRKKELQLAKKISPFAVGREVLPDLSHIQKATREEGANAILTKALATALDKDGRRMLKRS